MSFVEGVDTAAVNGQGYVVVPHPFEFVVPEDRAGGFFNAVEVAVASGVDLAVVIDEGDILGGGCGEDSGGKFGAPYFAAGERIDGGDSSVATDIEVFLHEGW